VRQERKVFVLYDFCLKTIFCNDVNNLNIMTKPFPCNGFILTMKLPIFPVQMSSNFTVHYTAVTPVVSALEMVEYLNIWN
jgi:hypothetical protein